MIKFQIKEIFEVRTGALLNRVKSAQETPLKTKAFNLRSVEKSVIDRENIDVIYLKKIISDEFYSKEGDILFKIVSPYSTYYVDKNYEDILVPSNFFILRLKKKFQNDVIPEYVSYILNSKEILFEIKKIQQGNAAVISLKKTYLENFEINIPDIEKQKKYSEFYRALAIRNNLLKQKLNLNEEYFQNVIGKFF
ncbi:hypothetical protein [uncultured Ilyobacter sp.]|uniref:hypothetical protein n=1 Tax=uncultured Ilyobacter sp. TaxID=544433 RepID=UPI0029C08E4E|nr:hypothetical protein [uncultured Ilyobacter sp.]